LNTEGNKTVVPIESAIPAPDLLARQTPAAPRDVRGKASSPPEAEVEQMVEQVWRDVLGYDNVSGESDFFALGGHSLLAVQIVARLRETIGVEVGVEQVFDYPTVGAFASEIRRLLAS
jgi:acyl carrier protein